VSGITTYQYVRGMPSQGWQPEHPDIMRILGEAEEVDTALLAAGSNYVFLLKMRHPDAGEGYAVYKPQRGEAPLSDFPDGTLYQREYAAYMVSEAIGWHLIPPTLIREDLSNGRGALQLFIEHDPSRNYFNLKDERLEEMKRIAVFDWLTNNADRKGGHCLLAHDGRMWCIDQGLTFHSDAKLRTVIWDYQGQQVPAELIDDVLAFGAKLDSDTELNAELRLLMSPPEYEMLLQRIQLIDKSRVFPAPPPYRPFPWPMI
jgi:uncharacterized repeat protein (TIGR03843 family)